MFRSSDSYDLQYRTSSINLCDNRTQINVADPRPFSYVNPSFASEEANHLKVCIDNCVDPSNSNRPNQQQVITELQWKNLDVFVQDRKGPKQILRSVNGFVDNTKMMAILGPSGAGAIYFRHVQIISFCGQVIFLKSKHCFLTTVDCR